MASRRPSSALTLLVGVVVWVLVNRTAFGVLCGLAGRNPVMVTWQGARLSRLGLGAFLLSGGTAGLAGAMECWGPMGASSAASLRPMASPRC